jgi:hypothetical protein
METVVKIWISVARSKVGHQEPFGSANKTRNQVNVVSRKMAHWDLFSEVSASKKMILTFAGQINKSSLKDNKKSALVDARMS